MIVNEIMTAFPKTLSPDANIRKAAQLMRDEDTGVIPIIDGLGVLVGIVTDRDIVVQAVADGHGVDTPVSHCMTPNPDTIPKDTTVEQAMVVMSERQIRRLPVVENGRLIGILSLSDLTNSQTPAQETGETLQQVSASPEGFRTPLPSDLTKL